MNKTSPADIASIAALLMIRHPNMNELEAIQAANRLVALAESQPVTPAAEGKHIHPRNVFPYTSQNWRKWTLKLIQTLFDCDVSGDDKTPYGVTVITHIESKGWKSPEEFLEYHEKRGFEPGAAAAIIDLLRRWKKQQSSIGPKNRKKV
jgi:hypothetical protein